MAHDGGEINASNYSSYNGTEGECNNLRAGEEVRLLVEYLEGKLNQLPSSSANYSIYRVPKPLREVKPEAYTPHLVSIGPFLHENIDLRSMEKHKLRLLKRFLARRSDLTLSDYVTEIMKLENQARQCYSEVIPFKRDKFVRMMVVDGCFILELILGWKDLPDDSIFNETWMPQIVRDLLLLENQLPFFVLKSLYKLYIGDSGANSTIYDITQAFLLDFLPAPPLTIRKSSIPQQIWEFLKHIFVVDHGYSQEPKLEVPPEGSRHLLDFVQNLLVSKESVNDNQKQSQQPRSATELKKATVKFEKSDRRRFSEISFNKGVLRIPAIKIDDLTESLLRNLVALEQSLKYDAKYVTGYAIFMDDLIKSPEDVKFLQDKEIFESLINPEEVAALFNSLLKEVTQPSHLCFSHVYNQLETYCNNPWRRVVAKIRQSKETLITTYFNNPWSFISLLAATALLGLTIAQTIAAYKAL